MTRLAQPALVALAMSLLAVAAQAHVVAGESVGFLSGVKHPISGLDHIVAMVSVGLWGAQLGAPAIWLLPVLFPLIMAVGGFLGLVGVPLPGTEIGIALSGIVLGAAVLLSWRPPIMVAAVLVGLFGLYHGHAAWSRIAAWSGCALVQPGFCSGDGPAPPHRHLHWPDTPLAMGCTCAAPGRRRRVRLRLFFWAAVA